MSDIDNNCKLLLGNRLRKIKAPDRESVKYLV